VGRGKGLDVLLELAGEIQQALARRAWNYEILDQAVGVLEVRYRDTFAE
jgi:hypothetical protein